MTGIAEEFRLLVDERAIAHNCAEHVSGDWGAVKDADLRISEFMQNNVGEILELVEAPPCIN